MSGLTWIQFLVLLHLTALTEQFPRLTVRGGDQVTLPFEAETRDQYECNRTTWRFTYFRAEAVQLVVLGQISDNAKSDRLSVAENCSLVIKKVTAEDAGHYAYTHVDEPGRSQESLVFLFVMNMTEQRDGDKVTLSCSVSTFAGCSHTATWLHEGLVVDEDSKDMRTSQSECSVNVTFPTSFVEQKPRYHELFRCHVYDHYNSEEQQFAFRTPQSTGEDATSSTSTAAPPTAQEAPTGCSAVNYIMLVLRVAELVLITVITVLLIRAAGNQRPPDDNTE